MDFKNLSDSVLLDNLPDEILLVIFSNLTVKEKVVCMKVSKRFRLLSDDNSLWTKIDLSHQAEVPTELICLVVKKGCTELDLSYSTYKGGPVSYTNNKLKLLDLTDFHQYDLEAELDQQFLPHLVQSCSSLEKLSLGQNLGPQFGIGRVAGGICKSGETLTSLNLSGCSRLHYSYIEYIINACVNLIEVNFSTLYLSDYALAFICKKLTTTIEKISFEDQQVTDKSINTLVRRCSNLSELNLGNTNISKMSVIFIASNLSSKLIKLHLPFYLDYEDLTPLNSMKNLVHLWMAPKTPRDLNTDPRGHHDLKQIGVDHDMKLHSLFPHLMINVGKLLIAERGELPELNVTMKK